jgi:hypothetical protein
MAGSKVYRQYNSDGGGVFTVLVDESNAEATIDAGTLPLIPLRGVPSGRLPSGFTPRYVLCTLLTNPKIRRKFKIGNPALVASALVPGAILKAQVYPTSADALSTTSDWTITAYRGEKINIVPSTGVGDTGLTDGDIIN